MSEPIVALRFHEGLRRRWREARAESSVRAAWALCTAQGISLPLKAFRDAATGVSSLPDAATGVSSLPDDATGVLALRALRAMTAAERLMPPLGAGADRRAHAITGGMPMLQLLVTLHRQIMHSLVPADEIGRPRGVGLDVTRSAPGETAWWGGPIAAASEVTPMVRELSELTAGASSGIVLVARVHAAIAVGAPFAHGNSELAFAVSRLLNVSSGVEPTGVAVPEIAVARDPNRYRVALSALARREPDAMPAWEKYVADWAPFGDDEGRAIASGVLAGRISPE